MRRAAVLAFLVTFACAPAAFAAAWSVQPTPNPPGMNSSTLAAVSCASDASCMAVGSSTTHAGRARVLAERWDGSMWTIQPLATVAGWTQSDLLGVSCVSATRCTAVGGAVNGSGKELNLAEHWNGVHWSVQATPNPSPSLPIHHLDAVSCPSASDCVAVGEFGKEKLDPFFMSTINAVVERWNGHRWRVQHVSRVRSGIAAGLQDVACTSASACFAVGGSSSPEPGSPLAWRWDGHRWSGVHPPNHGEFAGLLGVSCSSADSCVAVGNFFVSRDQNALSERWSGHHWSVQTPPRPDFAGAAELTSVSCPSALRCIAVGGAGPADPTGGLAESWDGMHWTIQPTPGGDGWTLQHVSCRPAACTAVGSHANFTLAERYS